jgi:DNA-directed RNA polymerase specialized sigma24 family protein
MIHSLFEAFVPRKRTPLKFTPQVFDRFLHALDPDRERAGERYEALRTSLICFFRWRGIPHPEDAADETLDRTARRIVEGTNVEDFALGAFVHGIAKNLCREIARRHATLLRPALELLRPAQISAASPPANLDEGLIEQKHECLSSCVRSLPADSAWIVRFYDCDGRDRIELRKSLAASMNIAPNALRQRAHEIRKRLRSCVNNCLGVQRA